MRFGVSAKVFVAYAVLLVTFAATSVFFVTSVHRARQEVSANGDLLDVQSALESCYGHLTRFDESPPQLAATRIKWARDNLTAASERVTKLLESQPNSPRRSQFEEYRRELLRLSADVDPLLGALPTHLASGTPATFTNLQVFRDEVNVFRQRLRQDAARVQEELNTQGGRTLRTASVLTLAGLIVGLTAALLVWRTLRPLHILRLHARQLASGDYERRLGVRTKDEIGDLAREFDAMAQALQEREQRLIRSERLASVGKIAAQITHEIRNPLAAIGLHAELLADELRAGENEGRRLLAGISGEVERLSEITESYLRFVRLPKPKLEPEDLGALVTAVLEFARAELARANINLTIEVEPGLPEIPADENQLRQALLNLVRNAREAMSAGGSLKVAVTRAPGDRVRIAVSDSGPGIPPDNLGKLFDPFFSTKEKGTGLGLSLVQQIISEHGGRVEVDTAPSRGTTFTLTFPIAGVRPRPSLTSAKTPEPEAVPAARAVSAAADG